MTKFWDLVGQSVIVQGVVTMALVFACIYMAIIGQEIPQLISTSTLVALGYYFGSKSQQYITQTQTKG